MDHNPADAHPSTTKASPPRQAKGQTGRRADPSRETNWANDTARYSSAQGEDSYEAAMRAADALFSGASARPSRAPDTASAARDVFQTRDVSLTRDVVSANDGVPNNDTLEKPLAEAPPPGGGRILRAMDEPPDTTLAEIEAERAPKRRGRKPGSKNKPKVQVAPPSAPPASHPVDDEDDDDIVPFDEVLPAPRPSNTPRLSVPLALPIVVPHRVRFAWVRTKLGPGEQWKRRLPKVIW